MYLTLQSSPFPCTSYINVHLRTPATLSSSETMMHSKIPLVGRLLLEIQFESQECIPVGCVPSAAVAVCPGGGYPHKEGGVSGRQPPVNRMTDRCKNITLPQLRCGNQTHLPTLFAPSPSDNHFVAQQHHHVHQDLV